MRTNIFWALSIAVVFLFLSACDKNPRPKDMPAPQPTTIKIVQAGQGLDEASVVLHPIEGKWQAGGTTDSSGMATLFTDGRYQGAVPGKYKVTVSKRESTGGGPSIPDAEKDPVGYGKAMSAAATAKPATFFNLVDPKFDSAETTEATVEVVQGKNDLSVDVGAAVHVKIGK